jgi:hypothetical protein
MFHMHDILTYVFGSVAYAFKVLVVCCFKFVPTNYLVFQGNSKIPVHKIVVFRPHDIYIYRYTYNIYMAGSPHALMEMGPPTKRVSVF